MLPEGWHRCADCHSREYEMIYAEYMKTSPGKKRNNIEAMLVGYREEIEKYLKKAKRNAIYTPRPSEDTCVLCHYEEEYKDSTDIPVKTFASFYIGLIKKYGGNKTLLKRKNNDIKTEFDEEENVTPNEPEKT